MTLKQTFDTISEKCKEIFCNKPIPSGFFPSEIALKLVGEAEQSKVTTNGGILVPNQYTFSVTREEYYTIEQIIAPLQDRILACLDTELEHRHYHTRGKLSFQFVISEEAEHQEAALPIEAEIEEEKSEEAVIEETEPSEDDCNLTRVFDKVAAPQMKPAEKQAVICVTEGVDRGKRFVFCDNRVNIGRLENNEMTLTDSSVSRLHAYIIKEAGNHTIYDARSLNGTYINDVQVIKQMLRSGDVIKVGNTIIEYEVL